MTNVQQYNIAIHVTQTTWKIIQKYNIAIQYHTSNVEGYEQYNIAIQCYTNNAEGYTTIQHSNTMLHEQRRRLYNNTT